MVQQFLTWAGDHWIIISLCASEVLPFIPIKYNGIAQSFVRIIGHLLKLTDPSK